MAAGPGEYVTVSEEHFLEPLGLPELDGGLPARRRELFTSLVELLAQDGLVAELPAAAPAGSAEEADLRIPGTAVHVHVSALQRPEVNEIVTLAAALNLHHRPEIPITLGVLQTLWRVVSTLKAQYGERSVLEALGKVKPPSADAVTGFLHGAPCRHPRARCRYMDDRTCTITSAAVTETLEHLEGKGVVRRLNAVEPIEYGVTF